MMLSPGAIGAVSEILAASDFYRDSHGKIYRAALDLYAQSEPVDAITLVDALEERGQLEEVGGRPRVQELASLVPATANAAHYARIVHELATLRGLIRVGGQIAQLGWERPGETSDLVDRAEQIVFDLSQQRVSTEFSHIESLLKESFERITKLYEAGEDVTGVPSGFRDLDRLTSGFQPGNLDHRRRAAEHGEVRVRALHRGEPAVRHERPVALFTLEMSKAEVTQRLMCSEAKVESQPPSLGQARPRRLATADGRLRHADEGADLRRRRRLDHDDGDPLEGAPAEVEGAEPRADRRRLHAADDLRVVGREPRPGGLPDLALAEDPRA